MELAGVQLLLLRGRIQWGSGRLCARSWMGGWCCLQAKAWGAWREVLLAPGAALVVLGLGCWMQWSCAFLLRSESSSAFEPAIWNHSLHPSRKSWQTLPMPCHFARPPAVLSVLTHCLLDSVFFRKERNMAPFLPSLCNSEDLTRKGRTAKGHLGSSSVPEGSVISNRRIVGFFTRREPKFPTVLVYLRCTRH